MHVNQDERLPASAPTGLLGCRRYVVVVDSDLVDGPAVSSWCYRPNGRMAERGNSDVHWAGPEDTDEMAACDPGEAIRVVGSRAEAHDVVPR